MKIYVIFLKAELTVYVYVCATLRIVEFVKKKRDRERESDQTLPNTLCAQIFWFNKQSRTNFD